MQHNFADKFKISTLLLAVIATAAVSFAGFDSKRHISLDEISPGDKAYCLTVYKGVEIEKFELEVLDVVRDVEIGRDAILVIGKDRRFIHTGPVAGCSGSPVYIDGRLAGALAFGWPYSKDPLYGVTPIKEILQAGTAEKVYKKNSAGINFDFSAPIDIKNAYQRLHDSIGQNSTTNFGRASALMCPLACSLPSRAFASTEKLFKSTGLIPTAGAGGGNLKKYKDIKLTPGAILAVPMVSGDIEMSGIGTVTEIDNGKVYAFGHSMTGQGPVDMPMATGYVNTVVASLVRSFKFGSAVDIKGALFADESTAVVGSFDRKAQTIPASFTVKRFNDDKQRYNCRMISHKFYTPILAEACLSGTALKKGNLPGEHKIKYKTKISLADGKKIEFENFSSANNLSEMLAANVGAIALVMNNPYARIDITGMDFEIEILEENAISRIWALSVSDSTVNPGSTITAEIVLQSYLGPLKKHTFDIKIPEDTRPGSYTLSAGGANSYSALRREQKPYNYVPENFNSLIEIINKIANTQNNRLHLMLPLAADGVAVETAELPRLPRSKALLLVNKKRASNAAPVGRWVEKSIKTDTIVVDRRELKITVEPEKF